MPATPRHNSRTETRKSDSDNPVWGNSGGEWALTVLLHIGNAKTVEDYEALLPWNTPEKKCNRGECLRRNLSGKPLDELKKICSYLRDNANRMPYGEYLAAAYPIASGIIEGACRNVGKDRKERNGMRWVYGGAHAMLVLRSIQLRDLWDEFI